MENVHKGDHKGRPTRKFFYHSSACLVGDLGGLIPKVRAKNWSDTTRAVQARQD
jgi:hypothetical protein